VRQRFHTLRVTLHVGVYVLSSLFRSYYSAPIGEPSIVMSVSVCLSVRLCVRVCLSVRDHTFGTTRPIFISFLIFIFLILLIFVHVTCGRGSVLLWRLRDTLCSFGFMDDVYLPMSQCCSTSPPSSSSGSLGLSYKLWTVIPVAG